MYSPMPMEKPKYLLPYPVAKPMFFFPRIDTLGCVLSVRGTSARLTSSPHCCLFGNYILESSCACALYSLLYVPSPVEILRQVGYVGRFGSDFFAT